MVDVKLEEAKIVVFGEASMRESVPTRSSSWEDFVWVEHPSYRKNM